MVFRWTFCALLFSVLALQAQEPATITIKKGERLDVALQPIGGPEGDAVSRVLRNDLEVLGAFDFVSGAQAGFTIGGNSTPGGLSGSVTDAAGRTVISSNYSGLARDQAHKFADDIVKTLTGKPGIAQSKIAFVATRTGRKEIYLADYDGGGVKQLTRDNSISVGPSLSPDGGMLAYTGYKSGYADIYVIDLRSGNRNRVIKFPGTNTGPAFSPDGGRLAATVSKDGNPELYTTSSGGGSPHRLTRTRGTESSPTWSPSGGEIIYVSDDGGSPQLYRISASGGSGRHLSTGHGYCTEPNWSPDGRKVAFNVRGGGGFQIAVLDLDSGSTRVLSTGGNAEDPVWGPNSRHLIYSSGSALYLLDSQTGKSFKIVDGLGKVTEPTWSR